jgi:membrane-associated phospholipid phosphatase
MSCKTESSARIASLPSVKCCLFLVGLACERPAWAQATGASASAASTKAPDTASLWRKDWPEFSTTEAILTATAAVGTGVIVLFGPAQHPRWEGGILFDKAVRNELRARDPETRSRFRTVGNYTYHLSPLIPIFDVLVVSAIGHGDRKLAENLGLVTLEAYSYTGLSAFVSTEISARARPDAQCQSRDCSADTQSFFSGHAAISATAAGLVCANHSRIALYDNAWADAAICALSAANALATATTRVVADRHYASDVIIGTSVGFSIGYAVPVLLHYSHAGRQIALGPDPTCGGNCVGVSGTF